MTKLSLRTREAIRARLAEDYYNLHGVGGYVAVGLFWGVSGATAWKLINDAKYWPSNKKILRTLKKKAEQFNL